jgi:hypothetical protein
VLFEFDANSYNTKYNVFIRTGSSMPVSKATERELSMILLQSGLLGSPLDPTVKRKVLEVMDIGGLDKILKDNAKDTNFAKKEYLVPVEQYQQMMEQAGPEEAINNIYLPSVNPFDNHDVHVIEHKNDLLDHYFEYIGTGDPGLIVIAQSMLGHWVEHANILREMQIEQALLSGQLKPEKPESKSNKGSSSGT